MYRWHEIKTKNKNNFSKKSLLFLKTFSTFCHHFLPHIIWLPSPSQSPTVPISNWGEATADLSGHLFLTPFFADRANSSEQTYHPVTALPAKDLTLLPLKDTHFLTKIHQNSSLYKSEKLRFVCLLKITSCCGLEYAD